MIGTRLWQIAGWTMLHYLWVGAALGAAVLLARQRLRSAAASVRYLFAVGSLLLLSVAPAAIAVVVMQSLEPLARSVPLPADSPSRLETVPSEEAQPTMTADTPVPAVAPEARGSEWFLAALNLAAMSLPWLWVCGAPLSFALTTAGLLGAERLRRQSRPLVDARITEMCRQLAVSLRISYRVGVAVCDRIAAPILVGIVRPMILLPAVALAGWDPQQLEMVLLHELAHVRRLDNLVNLLQRIVESLLFFQPMVWIISAWVRREREHCCDELVVARTRQPQAYAEILVTLAETFSQSPVRGASLAHAQAVSSMAERPLAARIRRILRKEEQAMQVSRKAVAVVLGSVLVLAAAIGGYYSRSSRADDPPAQPGGPAGQTARTSNSAVPGDVIEGMVVDERGEPQAGIDVWTLDWRGRRSTARTGPDGRFRLEVVEPLISEFSLVATDAEGTRQGILIGSKLGPSQLPLQRVVLKPSRSVDVQVVDDAGRPVVGATVESCVVGGTAWHVALGPVATDAQGKARRTVPADANLEWIAARKAGVGMDYVYVEADPAKGQSPPKTVKLVLNGVMPISVRVHDAFGRPVPHAEVEPWEFWKKGKTAPFCPRTAQFWAVSDAQGRVQFEWLPADLEKWVNFSVRKGDYYSSGPGQLPIKDGGARHLDIEVRAPAQVSGKVTYADGRPAAGITIQADGMGTGANRPYARTAEDRPAASEDAARPSPGVKKVLQALDSPTDVKLIEKPLKDAVDYLAKQRGIKIQFDREALREVGIELDVPMTRALKGVTLDSVLRLMLSDLALVHLIRDDGLLITTEKRGQQLLRQGAIDPAAYPMPNKAAATRKVADVLKATGSLSAVRTPLYKVMETLAAKHGCNIQIDNRGLNESGVSVDVPCTMTLKDVSLDSILRQLLAAHGLTYVVRDEVILIAAASSKLELRNEDG